MVNYGSVIIMGKETKRSGSNYPERPASLTRRRVISAGVMALATAALCQRIEIQIPNRGADPKPDSPANSGTQEAVFPASGLVKLEKVAFGRQERGTRQEFEALTFDHPLFSSSKVRVIDATEARALRERTHGQAMGKRALAIHHTVCLTCEDQHAKLDINHLIGSAQVSGAAPYDLVIGRSGEIFCLTDLSEISGALEPKMGRFLNEQTVNIALDGDFSRKQPAVEQLRALQFLIHWFYSAYGLSESDGVEAKGGQRGIVLAHREVFGQATACPGEEFLARNLGRSFERARDREHNLVGWSIERGKFSGVDGASLATMIYEKTQEIYPSVIGKKFDKDNQLDREAFRYLLGLCFSESSFRTAEAGRPIIRPNVDADLAGQTTFDLGPFQINSKYVLRDNLADSIRAAFDIELAVTEGVRVALTKLKDERFDWRGAAWAYKGKTRSKWPAAVQVHQEMLSIRTEVRDGRLVVYMPQIGQEFGV